MAKITDRLEEVTARGGTGVSFEFFPAKTEEGNANLIDRIESMTMKLRPTFVTLTWRSSFADETSWLRIGAMIQKRCEVDVLLHLTCHLPVSDLRRILRKAREVGIRNILALRGGPSMGISSQFKPVPGGFRNAIDLVRLIRAEHDDYFCIAVAGYPEVHNEAWNSPCLPPSEQAQRLDLERLKHKVDAGADVVLTQFVYDAQVFIDFEKRCRDIGIKCPIIPGYMVPPTYEVFNKFTAWCRSRIPRDLASALAETKFDDETVKKLVVKHGIEVCKKLLQSGSKFIHFFTMNLELSVCAIMEGLGLLPKSFPFRELPWRDAKPRPKEEVRPIFWVNRATSYLARTAGWDEFPNGRWGNSRSPAYGEITEYYLASNKSKVSSEELKDMWGIPTTIEDVQNTFLAYISDDIHQLPWADTPLEAESSFISENLKWLNRNGFLTINSQPKANGVASDHPTLGWGSPGGYVYQKAYVEFFVSPQMFERLLPAFARHPYLTYHAIDVNGREYRNLTTDTPAAVTWGVFPRREIIQPTVVDPSSFRVWKDEAFQLWLDPWQSLYSDEVPEEARARELLQSIHDTYVLVNIVDNEYYSTDKDMFRVFREVMVDCMSESALKTRLLTVEADNFKLTEMLLELSAEKVKLSTHCEELTERCKEMEAELAQAKVKLAQHEGARAITVARNALHMAEPSDHHHHHGKHKPSHVPVGAMQLAVSPSAR